MSAKGAYERARAELAGVLKIALLFGFLGPPIAQISLWIGVLITELWRAHSPTDGLNALGDFALLVLMTPFTFFIAYIFGFVPAAVAGLLVGVFREVFGKVTFVAALIIGLLVGFVDIQFGGPTTGGLREWRKWPSTFVMDGTRFLFLSMVYVLPTIGCWAVARRFGAFDRAPPQEDLPT